MEHSHTRLVPIFICIFTLLLINPILCRMIYSSNDGGSLFINNNQTPLEDEHDNLLLRDIRSARESMYRAKQKHRLTGRNNYNSPEELRAYWIELLNNAKGRNHYAHSFEK
ncbi:unnamed protein product [Didymodactylos carnosus]|uniref:Uncharacterized protein n=2 Tax=Didymodactylos carnosus TaxID=1234261 RepID=A0A8S2Q4Y2_9BILA|nr:unnamed protein product [Didymodactylos carnosus]CAF4084973.1 unnamed protein product [Didymodactylos carnosus]